MTDYTCTSNAASNNNLLIDSLPYSSDLGEAVGSKVDRRSSRPQFLGLSKHQVVARREARRAESRVNPLPALEQ